MSAGVRWPTRDGLFSRQVVPCTMEKSTERCEISLIFTSASSGYAIMIPYNSIGSNDTRCKMEIPMVYQSSDFQNNTFTILQKFQSLTYLDISLINVTDHHI